MSFLSRTNTEHGHFVSPVASEAVAPAVGTISRGGGRVGSAPAVVLVAPFLALAAVTAVMVVVGAEAVMLVAVEAAAETVMAVVAESVVVIVRVTAAQTASARPAQKVDALYEHVPRAVIFLPVFAARVIPRVLLSTGSGAVDLVRLVAHDDNGHAAQIARLRQLVEEAADVVEGLRVEQIVDEDVTAGVAKAVR